MHILAYRFNVDHCFDVMNAAQCETLVHLCHKEDSVRKNCKKTCGHCGPDCFNKLSDAQCEKLTHLYQSFLSFKMYYFLL